MSNTDEAMKIWNALKPMVNRQIEEKTRSCVRAKKMTVTTAPNGSVIGVAEPYGEEILIPYLSTLSGAAVGDAVWVWYYFNNASTMIAMSMGNGQIPFMSNSMVVVNVEGSTPSITAEADHLYLCGEVASISFTPPSSGIAEVIFTSGSTAATLTVPNTVLLPDWFSVEAGRIYDISILNGVYGAAASWTNPSA